MASDSPSSPTYRNEDVFIADPGNDTQYVALQDYYSTPTNNSSTPTSPSTPESFHYNNNSNSISNNGNNVNGYIPLGREPANQFKYLKAAPIEDTNIDHDGHSANSNNNDKNNNSGNFAESETDNGYMPPSSVFGSNKINVYVEENAGEGEEREEIAGRGSISPIVKRCSEGYLPPSEVLPSSPQQLQFQFEPNQDLKLKQRTTPITATTTNSVVVPPVRILSPSKDGIAPNHRDLHIRSSDERDDINNTSRSNNAVGSSRGPRVNRFDSGLGDCDNSLTLSTSPMSSAGSLSNQRISTHMEQHYEDIDFYAKEYKRRESERKARERADNLAPKITSQPRPSRPSVTVAGVTSSHSDDTTSRATPASGVRDSYEPPVIPQHRYGSIRANGGPRMVTQDGSLPHAYSHLNKHNNIPIPLSSSSKPCKENDKNRCGYMMTFLFVFMIIISLTSLAISLYVLISRNDYSRQQSPVISSNGTAHNQLSQDMDTVSQDMEALKADVKRLRSENLSLKASLYKINSTTNMETKLLNSKLEELSSLQTFASVNFQYVTDSIRSEIANISLTPGPRGPQGVGNFSLCKLKTTSIEMPASEYQETRTAFSPDLNVPDDSTTLFAFCSYTGATDGNLDYKIQPSTSRIQYRCICNGKVSNIDRTRCTLNSFVCPKLNFGNNDDNNIPPSTTSWYP